MTIASSSLIPSTEEEGVEAKEASRLRDLRLEDGRRGEPEHVLVASWVCVCVCVCVCGCVCVCTHKKRFTTLRARPAMADRGQLSHIGVDSSCCLHPHSPAVLLLLEAVQEDSVEQLVEQPLQGAVV